jgi:hypothetical protein
MTILILLLALLLALDAVLHGYLVYRFGLTGNAPFLVFAGVYAVLALAVFGLPGRSGGAALTILWITLGLTAIGFTALTLTFNKLQRDKTVDRAILTVDAFVVLLSAALLYGLRG